jgi:hypothetical protein
VTDRLIKITTALAIVAVATAGTLISHQHTYEFVRTRRVGPTARLLPFTADGLMDGPRVHL